MTETSPKVRARVGVLIPSSNTVMERDLRRGIDDLADLYAARMHLVETTADAEAAMLDTYLPQALVDIASIYPRVTVFGCTSAGALRGTTYDRQLCAEIAETTGGTAISTIASVSRAVAASGRTRLAVLTPYVDELNAKIRSSLESDGLEVIDMSGFGIVNNFRLAEPTPEEIADRAVDLVSRSKPEQLFISCTNFRALEAAPTIEARTGVPVLTSNMAVVAAVRDSLTPATVAP